MNKKLPPDCFDFYYALGPGRSYAAVADTLAHELHHRERDSVSTDALAARIECERAAHAREAADMERAAELLRADSLGCAGLTRQLDGAVLRARASAAAYKEKAELVRVVAVANTLDGEGTCTRPHFTEPDCRRRTPCGRDRRRLAMLTEG